MVRASERTDERVAVYSMVCFSFLAKGGGEDGESGGKTGVQRFNPSIEKINGLRRDDFLN